MTEDIILSRTKDRKIQMNLEQFVRFQLLVYCHLKGYMYQPKGISSSDLDCMTLLGMAGTVDLSTFCEKVVQCGIFVSVQSVRNALDKMEDKGLIIKEGKSRKTVYLNPAMDIIGKENIILPYICLSLSQ